MGIAPGQRRKPLALDRLPRLEAVFDLIYNPAGPGSCWEAEARGIPCSNGLTMLVAQAAKSSEQFTGQAISQSVQDTIVAQVGEPRWKTGCSSGCPAVEKPDWSLLAQRTGRPFVDQDRELESGRNAHSGVFSRYGGGLPGLEAQVLQDLGKGSGSIIATGDGCVTQEENYLSLRQNGKIIWIQRPLNLLSIQGGLCQEMGLEELFQSPPGLYARFAGCTVSMPVHLKKRSSNKFWR